MPSQVQFTVWQSCAPGPEPQDSAKDSAKHGMTAVAHAKSHQTRTVAHSRAGFWLTRLPFDVLVLIFELVYDALQLTWYLPSLPDPFSPTLFPFSLAAVAPLWAHALHTVPRFWTRVPLALDRPSPSFPGILALSAPHPLDILIARADPGGEDAQPDPRERRRVLALLHALYPHQARWRSLVLRTRHSSSLPALSGPAPLLIDLRLSYDELDPVPAPELGLQPTPPPLDAPLSALHLELTSPVLAAAGALPATLRSLVLAHTPSARAARPAELAAALRALPHLRVLHLRALHLEPDLDEEMAEAESDGLALAELRFRDMRAADVAAYARALAPGPLAHLCFIRCGLPRLEMRTAWLDVVDCAWDASALARLVGGVRRLGVYSCAGVHAELMRAVAEARKLVEEWDEGEEQSEDETMRWDEIEWEDGTHSTDDEDDAGEDEWPALPDLEVLTLWDGGPFVCADLVRMLDVLRTERLVEVDVRGQLALGAGDDEAFAALCAMCAGRVRWGEVVWEAR